MRKALIPALLLLVGSVVLGATGFHVPPASAAGGSEPIAGSSGRCTDFRVQLLPFLDFDITDEGWVWVQRSPEHADEPRFQSVSGRVVSSSVAWNDTPANHDSHDQNAGILVDPGQEHVLSNVNRPNTTGTDDIEREQGVDDLTAPKEIEMEWEIGTFPSERGKSVPQRYFPQWAWPNRGDRIWVDGHWSFDCGHAKKIGVFRPLPGGTSIFIGDDFWRTEIHPARAIASMRNQADTLPGTGTTRVPVTATDLYIHGRAGFVTDMLNCGMSIILGLFPDDSCPTKTSPIAENFSFHICLPERGSPTSELSWRVENGPGNTVASPEPDIEEVMGDAVPAGCTIRDDEHPERYDLESALKVTLPLAGSGVADVEVYARRIVAGWVEPPSTPLVHLRMIPESINLHESGDGGVIASDDGELTFFFASVDRAPNEWIRLADYAPVFDSGNSKMNDYDPSLFGDSLMPLSGASFDFYVRDGQDVTIRALVYDQDCYDGHFGFHVLVPAMYLACALDVHETGNNDALDRLDVTLTAPGYGSDPALNLGTCPGISGSTGSVACNLTTVFKPKIKFGSPPEVVFRPDYELDFTLEKLAPTTEDTSDLGVTKSCTHEGEVLVVDQPLDCTIVVSNPGPGLPRGVVVTDTLVTGLSPAQYTIGTPTVAGVPGAACTTSASGFSCELDTLRVGGTATIHVSITAHAPGDLTNGVTVSTSSTDPQASNDASEDEATVFLPVTVEVRPGDDLPTINPRSSGDIVVAIVTTPDFDATSIDASSVCFGDAEAPAQRACTEAHGTGHPQDVDRDRDVDLLLHYLTGQTGIDAGDTNACLTGVTAGGIHVYGCDAIRTT